jgi:hypothetical protein
MDSVWESARQVWQGVPWDCQLRVRAGLAHLAAEPEAHGSGQGTVVAQS